MNLKVIYIAIWQEVEPKARKLETISNMKFMDTMQNKPTYMVSINRYLGT
jgi:hypothetical protein